MTVFQEHGGHFQHGGQVVFAGLAFTANQHRQPGAAAAQLLESGLPVWLAVLSEGHGDHAGHPAAGHDGAGNHLAGFCRQQRAGVTPANDLLLPANGVPCRGQQGRRGIAGSRPAGNRQEVVAIRLLHEHDGVCDAAYHAALLVEP
jgi:hypothetical protein